MKTITVDASTSYDIHIGAGIFSKIGEYISKFSGIQKVCIVSDSTVFPLYGNKCEEHIRTFGYQVCSFVFQSGEESKNGTTYLSLLEYLASHQLTRTDLIVALGGGVTGDLAGFTAATYLRGIRYIQVPTTLLAAVDSSVGGKTAIDLSAGKNLAGAFYQPSMVLCDPELLDTLPKKVFIDGCAEVIKYAVLYDPDLFSHLESNGIDFDREMVISRCVAWKKEAVVADEFDRGLRKKLNLGHTFGHSVEKTSSYSVSHGCAVAIGMAIVSRSSAKRNIMPKEDCSRIIALLKQFSLPTDSAYSIQELLECSFSDKKRSGDTLDLIIPEAIGRCSIVPTPLKDLKSVIEAGY